MISLEKVIHKLQVPASLVGAVDLDLNPLMLEI